MGNVPKYVDYNGIKFINPYNFVPADFSENNAADIRDDAREVSGYLKCRLVTKSPLAVPGEVISEDGSGHKRYAFMRTVIDGKEYPVIPGSSLRGMIRSLYETATNSCFVTADPQKQITYRTKEAFKPGLVVKHADGTFELFDAKRYIFAVKPDKSDYALFDRDVHNCPDLKVVPQASINDKYGMKVNVTPLLDSRGNEQFYEKRGFVVGYYIAKKDSKNAGPAKPGYLCVGEPFAGKKHFESMFVKGKREMLWTGTGCDNNLKQAVEELQNIIDIYNDKSINKNAKNRKFYSGRDYINMETEKPFPVWYKKSDDGKRVYLSVASLGRSAFAKNMGDLLGNRKPCTERKALCKACRLFGMTGDESVGSRVRITDAVDMSFEKNQSKASTLKELAGPKPSYLPFYIQSRNRTAPLKGKGWSYDDPNARIRGRKYYWIHKENDYETNEKTERNSTMELLGVNDPEVFEFKLYFDSISKEQLEELKWILTLGENREDSSRYTRIGHGKPLGLGCVKVLIDEEAVRTFGETYEVTCRNGSEITIADEKIFGHQDIISKLLRISDKNACTVKVSYPMIVDDSGRVPVNGGGNKFASHQWFTTNYSLGNDPEKELPEIGMQNTAVFFAKKPNPNFQQSGYGRR